MGLGTEFVDGGAVTAGGEVVMTVGGTVAAVVGGGGTVAVVVVVVVVVVTRVEVVTGGILVAAPPHPASATETTRVALTTTRGAWCEDHGERHCRTTRRSLVVCRIASDPSLAMPEAGARVDTEALTRVDVQTGIPA